MPTLLKCEHNGVTCNNNTCDGNLAPSQHSEQPRNTHGACHVVRLSAPSRFAEVASDGAVLKSQPGAPSMACLVCIDIASTHPSAKDAECNLPPLRLHTMLPRAMLAVCPHLLSQRAARSRDRTSDVSCHARASAELWFECDGAVNTRARCSPPSRSGKRASEPVTPSRHRGGPIADGAADGSDGQRALRPPLWGSFEHLANICDPSSDVSGSPLCFAMVSGPPLIPITSGRCQPNHFATPQSIPCAKFRPRGTNNSSNLNPERLFRTSGRPPKPTL